MANKLSFREIFDEHWNVSFLSLSLSFPCRWTRIFIGWWDKVSLFLSLSRFSKTNWCYNIWAVDKRLRLEFAFTRKIDYKPSQNEQIWQPTWETNQIQCFQEDIFIGLASTNLDRLWLYWMMAWKMDHANTLFSFSGGLVSRLVIISMTRQCYLF